MARKLYTGPLVNVSFDLDVCQHAAECVRGMPSVFDTGKRPWIDPGQAGKFCSLLGGDTEIFAGRPLVSSYSFVEGDTSTPSNYSVYVPIRDYVPHDGVARERVLDTLPQFGVEPTGLDEMIAAVRNRPLEANSGLIAHVSLRMSASTIGSTVYLSSEAYGGTPR